METFAREYNRSSLEEASLHFTKALEILKETQSSDEIHQNMKKKMKDGQIGKRMDLHECYGQYSFNLYLRKVTEEDKSRISQEWAELYKSYKELVLKIHQTFFRSLSKTLEK